MASFVIFWSAIFAIIFFVLGIIFKALASAFNSLLTSLGIILAIGGLTSLVGIGLFLMYAIVDGITKEGFKSVIGILVMMIVDIVILIAIVVGLGAGLFRIIVAIGRFVLSIISNILEFFAVIFENEYAKFLKAIINRLDKC